MMRSILLGSKSKILFSFAAILSLIFGGFLIVSPASATASVTANADVGTLVVSSSEFSDRAQNSAVSLTYSTTSTVLASDWPMDSFQFWGTVMNDPNFWCDDSSPGDECSGFTLTGVPRNSVSIYATARNNGNGLKINVLWTPPDGAFNYTDLTPHAISLVVPAGLFVWDAPSADVTAAVIDDNNGISFDDSYFNFGLFNALPQNTVSFDANGGSGSMYPVQSSYSQLLPDARFSRTGFAFMGWSHTPTGIVAYQNMASYPFSSSETLYAVWATNHDPIPSTSGGFIQGMNPQPITISWQNTAPIVPADQAGNGAIKFLFNALAGSDALTRYSNHCYPSGSAASWCSGITLTSSSGSLVGVQKYVTSGSSNSVEFQFWTGLNTIPAGSTLTLTLPANLVNLGASTFTRVNTSWYSSDVEFTNNVNLGATASRSLSFNTDGGSVVSSTSFTGATIAQPSATSKTGYTFVGWFAASTGGSALSFPYTPGGSGAVTLYARWTANSNAVTYNVDGGNSVSNGSFNTGGNFSLPGAPSKAGYTFVNWFEAATGGSALGSTFSPSATGPITIYARWTANSNAVTYNVDGGSSVSSNSFLTGGSLVLPVAPTKTGFTFEGWFASASGGTALTTGYSPSATGPITLYAHWTAVTVAPATPVASVAIQIPVGQPIANAPVDLVVDGLKDQTGYTVTVHSTPQIIDQGTIWSGRLNTTVRIPAGLESGWHRLVIDGTAADGSPWTETSYFKVSPGGLLLATSDAVPAELAMTGANPQPVFYGAAFLMLLGLGFVAANTTLRRRSNKQ